MEKHQGSGAGRQGGTEKWMGQVVASLQEWGMWTDVEGMVVRMEKGMVVWDVVPERVEQERWVVVDMRADVVLERAELEKRHAEDMQGHPQEDGRRMETEKPVSSEQVPGPAYAQERARVQTAPKDLRAVAVGALWRLERRRRQQGPPPLEA